MRPKLSIIVTTYNQEAYIAQTLDSILMQNTNFDYEVIVADDASTDGTKQIIEQYASCFSAITLLARTENLGISKNWYGALMQAKGEFVTTLEGDDYWVDCNKIQKQVDFLAENPQYVGVSHFRSMEDDAGKVYTFFTYEAKKTNHPFTVEDFLKGKSFSYTATVHRNFFTENGEWYESFVTANRSLADFAFCLLILDQGPVYILPDKMSVYRIAAKGNSHNSYSGRSPALDRYKDHLETYRAAEAFFGGKYEFSTLYATCSFFPYIEAKMEKNGKGFRKIFYSEVPWKARVKSLFIFPTIAVRVLWHKLRGR